MGLQTIDRAVHLLQRLGNSGDSGLRLIDVQRELHLARPTAHRILKSLLQHGLVIKDETSRTYRLGWELAVLGWSVSSRAVDLREICQKSTLRLAQESGDTVLVQARSGNELVCIDRKAGSYPVKVFSVEVGSRRPLAAGAGPMAILAAMSPAEAAATLETLSAQPALYPGLQTKGVLDIVEATRERGYAYSDGNITPGVRGIAVAIRDARGVPIGSIGIAAIAERSTDERMPLLVKMMMRERAAIERRLREQADEPLSPSPGGTRPGSGRMHQEPLI